MKSPIPAPALCIVRQNALYSKSGQSKDYLDEPKGFISGKEPFGYHLQTRDSIQICIITCCPLYERGSRPTEAPDCLPLEAKVSALIFGCGLILWPFLSFGAIFVFDSPIRSQSDELRRHTIVYLTWFYPLLYGAAWAVYLALRRLHAGLLASSLAWALAAITPAYYIWFFAFSK